MKPYLAMKAKRILASPRKTRVEFTKRVQGNSIVKGIAYYLDREMVLMKTKSSTPTVKDAYAVIWNTGENKRPDNKGPMPRKEEMVVSYHSKLRSKERSILPDEIYEAILYGIPMDMSNPNVTKTKYFYDDIAVVVAWEDTATIVSEMSVAPTRRRGFLEQIPLMFEDLRRVGMEHGGLSVMNATSFARMMADRILNPIVHTVSDWFNHGLINYTEEERKLKIPYINKVSELLRAHEIYDYDMNKGVLTNKGVHQGSLYEGALFCPPLTDEQKEVLSKWGLSLKKSETGNVPTFAFRPVAEDAKYSQCHIYLFDMSQFSGNAHEWAQTKKSCKLTEL